MTISETLAREAYDLTYDELPPDVIAEAKRRLIDMVGCAIGGFDSPPERILRQTLLPAGGTAESSVCVSGQRTSCMNAALINGVMARFTEGVDRGVSLDLGVNLGHPSEIIPSVIAVGEREHSTGKDVVTAVVLGYELLNRICAAAGGTRALSSRGWLAEIRAGLVVPLVVGKLLGLNVEQLVNAVGLSGSFAGGLGIVDHGSEVVTMARNLRFPILAYQGILYSLMAQQGFEAPGRIFEGHGGFIEVVLNGQIDLERLTRRPESFSITDVATLLYPLESRLQGQTEALLGILSEHPGLMPERIARIRVTTSPRVLDAMADPSHRYPQNKETADSSAYYAAAVVVVDRAISLDQFAPERLDDPRIREVIDKLEFDTVPEWRDDPPWAHDQAPTTVEVTTVDGEVIHAGVEYFKGHPLHPLSDDELEDKFRQFARRQMGETQIGEALDAIQGIERLEDITDLAETLVVRSEQ